MDAETSGNNPQINQRNFLKQACILLHGKYKPLQGKMRWANYKCIPNPPWEGILPDYFKSGALGESPVWTSVAVIPKKIFHEMGGFPEGYWWGEDARSLW